MIRGREDLEIGGRTPEHFVDDYIHRDRNPLDIVLEIQKELSEPYRRRMAYSAIQNGIRKEILSAANPEVVKRIQIRRGNRRSHPRQ